MKKVIVNVLFAFMMVVTAVMPVAAKDQVSGEFILGKVKSIPEVKTEWERQCVGSGIFRVCVNVPVLYRRTSKLLLVLNYKTDKLSKKVEKAITECAALGASTSVAVAIETTSIHAAAAAFMPIFTPCVKANAVTKALHVKAKVVLKTIPGVWKRAS